MRGSHHLLVFTIQIMGRSHAKTSGRQSLIRPTLGCKCPNSLSSSSYLTGLPCTSHQWVEPTIGPNMCARLDRLRSYGCSEVVVPIRTTLFLATKPHWGRRMRLHELRMWVLQCGDGGQMLEGGWLQRYCMHCDTIMPALSFISTMPASCYPVRPGLILSFTTTTKRYAYQSSGTVAVNVIFLWLWCALISPFLTTQNACRFILHVPDNTEVSCKIHMDHSRRRCRPNNFLYFCCSRRKCLPAGVLLHQRL